MNQQQLVDIEKVQVKQEILDTIKRVCTNDCTTCMFGFCMFNKKCAIPHFTADKLPQKLKTLKSVLSNARSKERKKNGIVIPDKKKIRKGATPKDGSYDWRESSRIILGCEPKDHPLIKDDKWALRELRKVKNICQLTEILQKRNYRVYGKRLILIGSWQARRQ